MPRTSAAVAFAATRITRTGGISARLKRYKKGLTILAADQCPIVPKCVEDIAEASRALGLKPQVIHVSSARQSRELPTPYGMFSILYDGELIADRPISGRRFRNIMSRLA